MSHFLLLVTGDDIDAALAPFDENIEVDRYVRSTREELIEGVRERHDDYMSDPDLFREKCAGAPEFVQRIARQAEERKDWTDDDWHRQALEYYEPDEISPDGGVYSTYNPKSKWDWYVIGGRWDNSLTLKDGTEANSALLKDIDREATNLIAFAYLHDGEWHERGNMGWFGVVTAEQEYETWRAQFDEFIDSLSPDTRITMVDAHI